MFNYAIEVFVLRVINCRSDTPINILSPITLRLCLIDIRPSHLLLLIFSVLTITLFLCYKYSTLPHLLFLLYCLQWSLIFYQLLTINKWKPIHRPPLCIPVIICSNLPLKGVSLTLDPSLRLRIVLVWQKI